MELGLTVRLNNQTLEILWWFIWIIELADIKEPRKISWIEKCTIMRWIQLINCFLGYLNIFKTFTFINGRKPIFLERIDLWKTLTWNILSQITIGIEANWIWFLPWRGFSCYSWLTNLKKCKIGVGAYISATIRVINDTINSKAPFLELLIERI